MGKFASSALRMWILVMAGALFASAPASAIQHEVRILLDLDNDTSTGCTVTTVDGPFDGADQVLITTVETSAPPPAGVVTDVASADCINPVTDTFGPPASFGGGWPVGIDNGVGGRDVVETYFPLVSSVVASPTTVRLGVVVTDENGGEQALLTTNDAPGGPPILLVIEGIDITEIPTLGEWGLLLLVLLLAAASIVLLGRRGTVALGLTLLVLAAGTAWAAGTLDGLTGDWSAGDQLATDGIVLFGKKVGNDLCFRVDVALLFNGAPTADAQAVSTPEDTPVAITLTGSDPESDPLTFSIVTGPAHGSLTGVPPNVTYTPDADYEGPDSFVFQVEDPSGGTDTATVTITVTPVNDAPVVNPATFTVSEDAAPGTSVGTVTYTDPDSGQSHTFAITAGNVGGVFAIDATTGEVTVAGALDYETLSSYSLTVEVTDDGMPVLSGSDTITVNVTDVDDPPTAVADAATVIEDDPATTIDVLANDTDTDGGPKSVQSVTQPAGGTVVITNAGADLTYQPDADFCNDPPGTTTDDFVYTLNGGSSATVSVTVTCVDDEPVAVDDAATVAEDSGATVIDVLANDTDIDGGAKAIVSVTQPANGTVVPTGGSPGAYTGLTYAPDADHCNDGSPVDAFTYTLNGGSSATVRVTVTCSDDAPVAVDDSATVGEDSGANAIDVLANDTDIDGGPKSVQSVTQPGSGTVVITGGGSGLTYEPDANDCNAPPGTTPDTFIYTLNGGSMATVSVTVTCSDDPPLAVADSATVAEDSGANAIDVLANDTDIDGGPKMVTVVGSPTANGGTVTITGGGSGVTYAPAANYCNSPPGTTPDTFTYTLNGGSMATVSVTVTCVDDAPVLDLDADDDKGTAGTGFAVTFDEDDPPTLIEDADDPTGATITDVDSATLVSLTVTLTNLIDAGEELLDADVSSYPNLDKDYDTTTSGVGVLTLSSMTPQPIADYVAVLRTVTYRHTGDDPDETDRVVQFVADDGTSNSNTATSTVSVVASDDDPVAVDDSATVTEDDPATAIDVLGNDTDVDGGTKAIASVTQPTNGTVVPTGGSPGAYTGLTYQPDADYCNSLPMGSPTDDFTYTLNGGSSATVAVTVTCADDPPTAVDDTATVAEDSGATVVAVLANDTDPDGGPKVIASVTQPGSGTVVPTGGSPGAYTGLTYAPNADYCNAPPGTTPDTFTYTLNGGSSATVSMTVTCVDDDPVAVNDSATVTEDSGATAIDVLANDTDVDGGSKTIISTSDPANGTVVVTGGGTGLTYQPDANYCNAPPGTTPDTFSYTLNGGSMATVSVTVTCVDDPPVAVADAATVNEDSGATAIDVLSNDTDIDGGPKTIGSVTQPGNGTVVITGGGSGLTYQPAANYCNGMVAPSGSPDTFSYTLNGGSSTTVSMTVICINDPPVAGNDTFDFIGNTELEVDLATSTTPHASETTGSGFGLLDNDSDPVENDPISIVSITGCADGTAPFDCTIAGVGTVHVQSNGKFSFVPLPGDTDAAEMFTYTLSDGTDTVNATVTLNRTQRVWYVDNNTGTAGVAGTSADPFDTLVEAQTASLVNDYIFVHTGDGTTTGQNAGITLKTGQRLLGQGVGLSIPVNLNGNGSPTVLVAAGTRPLLGDATAGGPDGVSAVDSIPAEVAGLSLSGNVNAIEWTTNAAFAGTGTLDIHDNVVSGAGAIGVDVNLAGTGATRLSFHDNALTATTTALNIQETGAGALTITAFANNSVDGNTGGSGIVINNAIFDATPGGAFDLVSGGTTVVGSSGNRVGGSGIVWGGISGDLLFTDLDVFADGGVGIQVGGTGASNLAGGTGMRFRVGAGVGTVAAIGGPAVSLSSLTADLQVSTLTSTGSTTTGVSLTGVTDGGGIDAVFTAGSGSAVTLPVGAAGPAFSVSGGNERIAYAGTITNNSSAARAVSISTWAGDDATDDLVLSGAIDENGAGILVNGNSGARAITFSGGLDIDTTTGEGFAATSNTNTLGLNITGSANDIDSVSATALRVTSTPIGSSNLNFRHVSSGNNTAAADPANGIVVNSTGTLGGLKITGTGGAATGGTIQHASSIGINLTSTRNVDLASMQLNDFGDFAIRGSSVVGFVLTGTTINGVNGDSVPASEGSVRFTELTGVASISSSSISGGLTDNLAVVNTTGTLDRVTLSGVTVGANSTASGSDGVFMETQGTAVIKATVQNSFFTSSRGDLAQFTQGSTGSMDVVLDTNAFSDNHPLIVAGGGGVVVGGTAGSMTFNVHGNTFRDATGTAFAVSCGNAGQSCVGRVENNQVGLSGTVNSGSTGGSGIAVVSSGGGTLTALVNNNQVRQYNNHGILLQAGQTLGNPTTFNVTVTNNTVSNPGSINTNFNGIHLNNGTVPGESFTSCADIRTNSIAGSGTGAVAPNNADYRLRQRQSTTVRLPGYGGANNNDAAVVTFVSGNQTTVSTGEASNTVGSGGGGFVGGASCALPP